MVLDISSHYTRKQLQNKRLNVVVGVKAFVIWAHIIIINNICESLVNVCSVLALSLLLYFYLYMVICEDLVRQYNSLLYVSLYVSLARVRVRGMYKRTQKH